LYDVVQWLGLFIEDGPIVQVKDRDNKPSILRDKDKSVLYSGPLAVMVNESALRRQRYLQQLYRTTAGGDHWKHQHVCKGTVQRNIGLDQGFSLSNTEDLGTVKTHIKKFYRINGGSNTVKGVSSDVVLPDELEFRKLRKKMILMHYPGTRSVSLLNTNWNAGYDLKTIQQLANQRVENDPAFKLINRTQTGSPSK